MDALLIQREECPFGSLGMVIFLYRSLPRNTHPRIMLYNMNGGEIPRPEFPDSGKVRGLIPTRGYIDAQVSIIDTRSFFLYKSIGRPASVIFADAVCSGNYLYLYVVHFTGPTPVAKTTAALTNGYRIFCAPPCPLGAGDGPLPASRREHITVLDEERPTP